MTLTIDVISDMILAAFDQLATATPEIGSTCAVGEDGNPKC